MCQGKLNCCPGPLFYSTCRKKKRMKNQSTLFYINRFIRAYPYEFTIKDFIRYMGNLGVSMKKEDAEELIDASPYVFCIDEGKYVTRSVAFSNRPFSVCITKEEIDNQTFIPGHRLIPFADQEMLSCSLTFFYNGNALANVEKKFSKEFALEHFSLFGEEYESQYIASDPAMSGFNLAENNFELPMTVTLTGVDLSLVIKEAGLKAGDRLLLTVENWDDGIISVEPVVRGKGEYIELSEEDVERGRWYKNLNKFLLESFEINGPCSSIEEQLANVFFSNIDSLAVKNCGSIEEYLKKTKDVSAELFGVETRLWYQGKSVPAVGVWNGEEDSFENTHRQNLLYSVPDYVLDQYLMDFAFQKKTNVEELITTIFPKTFYIPEDRKQEILLHITSRNDIIQKNYNWFADHQVGDIRHKALLLYTRISALVYEIDRTGGSFKSYPQQELVILIQLYTHLTKLVESIAFDAATIIHDSESIFASLDGMNYNFEEIEPDLNNAIFACKKNDFTVIR